MLISMLKMLGTSSLSLVNMDIGDAVCDQLSEFGESLQFLSLVGNKITCQGMDALSVMPLQSLDVSFNPITGFGEWHRLLARIPNVYLRGCFADVRDFNAFCAVIRERTWSSHTIDLSFNDLNSEDIELFVEASRGANVTNLKLANNNLDDRTIAAVMNTMNAQHVCLNNNQVTDYGVQTAVNMFEKSRLVHLSVNGCAISPHLVHLLEMANMYNRCKKPVSDALSKKYPDIIDNLKSALLGFI
jgi:hypothetical protein